ncbi:hypothetical protein BJ170DRAFT_714485 [Xylariales sp. AK1849]|nr:hypothetical protein BJ170DRAFT_714485 [Xylariales sp. AK1849]
MSSGSIPSPRRPRPILLRPPEADSTKSLLSYTPDRSVFRRPFYENRGLAWMESKSLTFLGISFLIGEVGRRPRVSRSRRTTPERRTTARTRRGTTDQPPLSNRGKSINMEPSVTVGHLLIVSPVALDRIASDDPYHMIKFLLRREIRHPKLIKQHILYVAERYPVCTSEDRRKRATQESLGTGQPRYGFFVGIYQDAMLAGEGPGSGGLLIMDLTLIPNQVIDRLNSDTGLDGVFRMVRTRYRIPYANNTGGSRAMVFMILSDALAAESGEKDGDWEMLKRC